TFGAKGAVRRLRYILNNKSGITQRELQNKPWSEWPTYTGTRAPFVFDAQEMRGNCQLFARDNDTATEKIAHQASEVSNGALMFFSGVKVSQHMPWPWFEHPLTNKTYPHQEHFSRIPEGNLEHGDIKYIWEPSRFSFVFDWLRA